jgi:hypothetical protein
MYFMPLVNPKKAEKEKEFISRCAGDSSMVKEFPNPKQRLAVCYNQLKKKAKASESIDWDDSSEEDFIIY